MESFRRGGRRILSGAQTSLRETRGGENPPPTSAGSEHKKGPQMRALYYAMTKLLTVETVNSQCVVTHQLAPRFRFQSEVVDVLYGAFER